MAIRGKDDSRGSIVSGSSVVAAGLASALAAAVTSSLGWAGGLIGAALTTMIITGGSAILNAYIQNMKNRVQAAPGNIRAATQRVRPQGSGETLPGTPGLRDNFMGRLRGALGWFSRLPIYQRRSILKRGMLGAAAAFVVGIVAITAVEFGIGNSLACGLWGNCPATSAPGFNGGNAYVASGARTGYTILGGSSAGGGVAGQGGYEQQGGGGLFGGGNQQAPVPQQPQGGGGLFGGGNQQTPVPQQPGGGGVFGGGGQSQQPAQPAQPAQPEQPVQPTPAEPVQPQAPAVPQEGGEAAQ